MTNGFLGLKKNNKGQVLIESVLLMTILLGAFIAITNKIKNEKYVARMVKKPIAGVAAMTAYGTWKADGCTAPGKSRQTIGKCHPNAISRSLSSDPQP